MASVKACCTSQAGVKGVAGLQAGQHQIAQVSEKGL